jgi:hypothetical protein
MATVTCGRCGKQAEVDDDDDGTPLGWSFETERGRVVKYCVECVRENIRAIEGKLSEEYW